MSATIYKKKITDDIIRKSVTLSNPLEKNILKGNKITLNTRPKIDITK
jgi:hypothetical protein